MGSGTTGAVAIKNGRRFIGYEISREYYDLAKLKLEEVTP
jgi:DNA modification methylase